MYGTDAELGFAGASDEPETSEQADEPDEVASGWDVPAVSDDPDRPNFDDIHLPEGRQEHLLDGDATGGGHRHGTGRPKKTEFPEYWSDETIIDNVADVARNPDKAPFHQDNGRWRARGTRDEVEITAILEPDGRIWTAWPHEGGPGVVRNPKEGQQ